MVKTVARGVWRGEQGGRARGASKPGRGESAHGPHMEAAALKSAS